MAIVGKFNTDSKALVNRIAAHDKYGSKDINEWIFKNLELCEGLSILDLGSGTGKQTIPMAEIVGPRGNITAVDVSDESLGMLINEARNKKLEKNITVLNCDLDNLNAHLHGNKFDRVLASYSIYYSKNPGELYKTIRLAMKPNGLFFFCGPSSENNSELKKFIATVKDSATEKAASGADFIENTAQQLTRNMFSSVEISIFENPLKFDTPDSLYSYWSSYNLYDEKLDSAFQEAAKKHFKTNDYFITYKRVLGVKAKKQ